MCVFGANMLDNRGDICSGLVDITKLFSKTVEQIYNPRNNVTEFYLLHIFCQKLILLFLLIIDFLLMYIDILIEIF